MPDITNWNQFHSVAEAAIVSSMCRFEKANPTAPIVKQLQFRVTQDQVSLSAFSPSYKEMMDQHFSADEKLRATLSGLQQAFTNLRPKILHQIDLMQHVDLYHIRERGRVYRSEGNSAWINSVAAKSLAPQLEALDALESAGFLSDVMQDARNYAEDVRDFLILDIASSASVRQKGSVIARTSDMAALAYLCATQPSGMQDAVAREDASWMADQLKGIAFIAEPDRDAGAALSARLESGREFAPV